MNIAVTGGSGDIGGAFVLHMAPQTTCHVLARKDSSHAALAHPNVHRFTRTDAAVYDTAMLAQFANAQAVVHFAALLNTVTDPEEQLIDYLATNALLTGLLTALSSRSDGQHMVYISSEMVYELEDTAALRQLAARFVTFCDQHFNDLDASYDLQALAREFIAENTDFAFSETNIYTLTKYLGEAVVQTLPSAAVVRVACAYGPEYTNARLIPRLAAGRLTGDGATYAAEDRYFVYSADINALVEAVITQKLSGVIDCRPRQTVHTRDLSAMIVASTPTAYGELHEKPSDKQAPKQPISPAGTDLTDIIGEPTPFADGLAATLRVHKDRCYHQMENHYTVQDFLQPGERIDKMLVGNSASYTFVVANSEQQRVVRKVALREGIEGNGVAKLNGEIRYYRHAAQRPELRPFYPRLLDYSIDPAHSSETIEYLDGPNFYAALKDGARPYAWYEKRFSQFIDTLCDRAINESDRRSPDDPERSLDAYYVERALSRLQSIHSIIPLQPTIRINGRKLLAPERILDELMTDAALRQSLLPRIEYPCFHGDMTLLNTILLPETQGVKLIDPRGVTGAWDPLYDFAKLKFTLTGFGELILEQQPLVTQDEGGYQIHFERIPTRVRQLDERFYTLLDRSPSFQQKIGAYEPYWRARIALANAVHHLSDIPFRLFTDDTDWKAISLYVLGTYYLNEAYQELKHGQRADELAHLVSAAK